jgi:hypothetical protein
MAGFRRAYEVCRLGIQTQIGRSPRLYPLLHRARGAPRSRYLVGAATDVCIEGPSGSGNSFFVNGFLMINPDVRAAHHHHVGAQLKRSVALSLPTLAILRNPIDCAGTRGRAAPWMVGPVLSQWIHFFRTAEALGPSILTLRFETIVEDPGGAIDRLNTHFRCSSASEFPAEEEVFARMDEGYARLRPGEGPNPNRPDPGRKRAVERTRELSRSHSLAPTAVGLYERLRRSAQ